MLDRDSEGGMLAKKKQTRKELGGGIPVGRVTGAIGGVYTLVEKQRRETPSNKLARETVG